MVRHTTDPLKVSALCFLLTWRSVSVEPDWADPDWWAGCGYSSQQLSGTWATSWRTWWWECSHASAGGAGTEPCGTWTRSHRRLPEARGSPLLLLHWPPPAAQRPTCCPTPRWWGTGRPGFGPGRAARGRRWQRGSQRCQSRRRGEGQAWWSGTAVRSKSTKRERLHSKSVLEDDQQIISSINNNQQDNTSRMKPNVREQWTLI